MDVKSNVKKRREERIKQLMMADRHASARDPIPVNPPMSTGTKPPETIRPSNGEELDPEWVWKSNNDRWKESPVYSTNIAGTVDGKLSIKQNGSFFKHLFIRFGMSLVVFIILWGINETRPSWAMPLRAFVAQSLTEEMDFASVQAWYGRNFGGAPSFIPIFGQREEAGQKVSGTVEFSRPLSGKIVQPFAFNMRGVEIIPDSYSKDGETVQSIQTGRVLKVSQDALIGETIVIQHGGGYVSIYGHLGQLFVTEGDWIEAGDTIASLPSSSTAQEETLYLAIQQDGRFMDPAEVIPFD